MAAALALSAGLLALFFLRRSRRNRCHLAVRELFAPYAATQLETREALAIWLNQHWPEPYDIYRLDFGRYYLCAEASIASYPLLLRGNLWPSTGVEAPTLHLLLAAQSPSPQSVPAIASYAAGQALARCQALGFECLVSEAGVLAIATPEKTNALRRAPRELSELGPALLALAEAAASLGAAPG